MILRRRRAFACIGAVVLVGSGILAACSDDESPGAGTTDDAGDARGADDRGTSSDAPYADGATGGDTGVDAPADAASDAIADADADAPDAFDAGPSCPAVAERVSPASGPWGVAVRNGKVYWTEPLVPAVRACALSGCTSLPASLIPSGSTLPFGIVADDGRVFFTDNQCPSCGLYALPLDGGSSARWGNVAYNGAGATMSGGAILWGNSGGLYRTLLADGGDMQILTGSFSGGVANGPETVAVDGTNVYSAPNGTAVVACPLGQSCTSGGATTIATVTANASNDIEAIAADGTNVFFTDGIRYDVGGSGKERLSRCPVAGCPAADGGNPATILYEATVNGPSGTASKMGIAVDATNVYWGSLTGKILRCTKTGAAPCTPVEVVTGVRPFGMALDGDCLYWAENGGGGIGAGGIYRIKVP